VQPDSHERRSGGARGGACRAQRLAGRGGVAAGWRAQLDLSGVRLVSGGPLRAAHRRQHLVGARSEQVRLGIDEQQLLLDADGEVAAEGVVDG
jgi:hypothetical protein